MAAKPLARTRFDTVKVGNNSRVVAEEFFPSRFAADVVGNTFLEFFQVDKETETQKGIVALDL